MTPGPAAGNVADTVARAAGREPSAPALISDDGSVVTWADLDARADAVAGALRALDLPASMGVPARVVIALGQVPEFAAVFFGTLRAGLVAVPVNPGYTRRELRHVLADSAAAVAVATSAAAAAIQAVRTDLPALRHVYAPTAADGALAYAELTVPAAATIATGSGEDLAVLLYTSGTSGAPKGAMLPHRALLANQGQVAAVHPPAITASDVALLALPLFHIFGLSAGLIAIAYHGACGVLLERFDVARSLAAIARHRVSVVAAVPQMYAAWLADPELAARFAAVRVAASGGAPLPSEVGERFLAVTGRHVHQGYGLTETAPVLTTGLASPVPKVSSIGRPVPGVDLRLVAADGTVVAELTAQRGVDTPPTQPGPAVGLADDDAFEADGTDPGQIVVRGENLFLGYWPDRAGGPDEHGWWATGDIAYADIDGDLFLVDRLGDLILVNGFNVYPREVEQVLGSHPGVAEAAVIGVPDAVTGEAVFAYVVPAGGHLSVDELGVYCGHHLARYKCPAGYEVVAELPHSLIGKVRKPSLRRPETGAVVA